eukprot:m.135145 g.135145  ORF g.135145 m.135145 type:complete len:68 (+) comp29780_c0_seq5:353-556(+)
MIGVWSSMGLLNKGGGRLCFILGVDAALDDDFAINGFLSTGLNFAAFGITGVFSKFACVCWSKCASF